MSKIVRGSQGFLGDLFVVGHQKQLFFNFSQEFLEAESPIEKVFPMHNERLRRNKNILDRDGAFALITLNRR